MYNIYVYAGNANNGNFLAATARERHFAISLAKFAASFYADWQKVVVEDAGRKEIATIRCEATYHE